MDIYIRDKDSPKYLRGRRILDYQIMNQTLINSFDNFSRTQVRDLPTHLELLNAKLKTKFIFGYYEDLEYNIKLGKAAGPAYRWFIEYYPLNFEADSNGTPMYQTKGAEIWTNEKFDEKWVNCWAYDINSAYPAALLKPIPDVNNELGPGTIEQGEVGFVIGKDGCLTEVEEGFAAWRFKLIKSPWADKYIPKKYGQLQKAKQKGDKETARKIKDQLNIAIGVLRNHNAFLYTHILNECKKAIYKYIDENTISVNTDCIYSAVPRHDIPLGSEIGLFKELAQNGQKIYFKGANYQWESGKKSLRGIPVGLQETYDLETGVQTLKPDYQLIGGKITNEI